MHVVRPLAFASVVYDRIATMELLPAQAGNPGQAFAPLKTGTLPGTIPQRDTSVLRLLGQKALTTKLWGCGLGYLEPFPPGEPGAPIKPGALADLARVVRPVHDAMHFVTSGFWFCCLQSPGPVTFVSTRRMAESTPEGPER